MLPLMCHFPSIPSLIKSPCVALYVPSSLIYLLPSVTCLLMALITTYVQVSSFWRRSVTCFTYCPPPPPPPDYHTSSSSSSSVSNIITPLVLLFLHLLFRLINILVSTVFLLLLLLYLLFLLLFINTALTLLPLLLFTFPLLLFHLSSVPPTWAQQETGVWRWVLITSRHLLQSVCFNVSFCSFISWR